MKVVLAGRNEPDIIRQRWQAEKRHFCRGNGVGNDRGEKNKDCAPGGHAGRRLGWQLGLCALRQGMTFRVFIVKWGQYRHLLPRGTAMRWHSWGTSEAHVNGSSHNTNAILSNAETFNEADVQECDGRRPRKLGGKGGWRPDNNEP